MVKQNGLHRFAGGGALLVGGLLVTAAFGHFQAVLPLINDSPDEVSGFTLLFPGFVLVATGALSMLCCKALWDGRQWAVNLALAGNTLAFIYLLYLMRQTLPGHPIAIFTGTLACNLLLLALIRVGLVWTLEKPVTRTHQG